MKVDLEVMKDPIRIYNSYSRYWMNEISISDDQLSEQKKENQKD